MKINIYISGVLIIMLFACTVAMAGYAQDSIADPPVRHFDKTELEQLGSNDDFFYLDQDRDAEKSRNALEQFGLFLKDILESVFGTRVAQFIFINLDLILITILFILVVFIIFKMNNLTLNKLFYRKQKLKAIRFSGGEDDIDEMDLAALIEEAMKKQDYRLAIRYHYLETLKLLAGLNMIKWNPDKTNHQYINELAGKPEAGIFRQLARVFDYVWYGDFKVSQSGFELVSADFKNFKKQLLR